MALFKVYHGDKDNLPSRLKDEYGYIVVYEDSEIEAGTWTDQNNQEQDYGIGEWYIDTDNKRYRIAAAKLIDEEGNLYSLEDIVQKDNITDDLLNAIYDDNNQESKLSSLVQEKFLTSFNAAKKEESITMAQTIRIPSIIEPDNGWRISTNIVYISIALPERLQCGSSDSSIPVPPLIALPTNATNAQRNIYDLIYDAEVNDNKTSISFYVSRANSNLLTSSIDVIVIDHR